MAKNHATLVFSLIFPFFGTPLGTANALESVTSDERQPSSEQSNKVIENAINRAAEKQAAIDRLKMSYWTFPLEIIAIEAETFFGNEHYETDGPLWGRRWQFDVLYLKIEQGIGYDPDQYGYKEELAGCQLGNYVHFGRYFDDRRIGYDLVLKAFAEGKKVRLKLNGCVRDDEDRLLSVFGIAITKQ